MSKALVFLADGFEEIEAITIIDVLRRGNVEVVTSSISSSKTVKGAHGIEIQADSLATEATQEASLNTFDMVALPGGLPGATYLQESPLVAKAIQKLTANGKWVSAICAAPKVLCSQGVVKGKKITHYPGAVADLNGAIVVDKDVVVDGKITTGRGPAAAFAFALQLVENLKGKEASDTIAKQALLATV